MSSTISARGDEIVEWIREKLVGVGLNEEIDATKEFADQLQIEI